MSCFAWNRSLLPRPLLPRRVLGAVACLACAGPPAEPTPRDADLRGRSNGSEEPFLADAGEPRGLLQALGGQTGSENFGSALRACELTLSTYGVDEPTPLGFAASELPQVVAGIPHEWVGPSGGVAAAEVELGVASAVLYLDRSPTDGLECEDALSVEATLSLWVNGESQITAAPLVLFAGAAKRMAATALVDEATLSAAAIERTEVPLEVVMESFGTGLSLWLRVQESDGTVELGRVRPVAGER